MHAFAQDLTRRARWRVPFRTPFKDGEERVYRHTRVTSSGLRWHLKAALQADFRDDETEDSHIYVLPECACRANGCHLPIRSDTILDAGPRWR